MSASSRAAGAGSSGRPLHACGGTSHQVSLTVRGKGERVRTVALVGNPNTGKSTVFNALTGFRQHVANYPGVTVAIARGTLRGSRVHADVVDLPGTYSLAAQSPDEAIVSEFVHGRVDEQSRPDCIVVVLDASNLRRNLYLLSQVLERGTPVVAALNMSDVARRRGMDIDAKLLSTRLGIPCVAIVGTNEATLPPLIRTVERVLEPGITGAGASPKDSQDGSVRATNHSRPQAPTAEQPAPLEPISPGKPETPAAEVRARYAWIDEILQGVIRRSDRPITHWSERLDRLLTHRFGGVLVLGLVLTVLFQAIFRWAAPLMDLISEGVFGRMAVAAAAVLPPGVIQSLVTDGLIGGVGGVLVFLPQIMILFALIAVLEDCGYMARAAFMVDRLMRPLGLSGRAFIPLLSSFACAVPAIMGTRVISDRRERLVTILLAPFMSCSARLPVYVLLIATFVPAYYYVGGLIGLQGLVMLAMYGVGAFASIPAAWLLNRVIPGNTCSTFLLELPSYKRPRLGAVWRRMYFAGKGFVVQAGTIILLVNLGVWALGYFPHDPAVERRVREARARPETRLAQDDRGEHSPVSSADIARPELAIQFVAEAPAGLRPADGHVRDPDSMGGGVAAAEPIDLESEISGAYLRDSYLGRMGRAMEPAIRPLGWDWRIGAAVIASFPAREVVIGTLGTIFNLSNADEESADLREALRTARWPDGRPIFTLPVALSVMVFFALCMQCASTLVMIGRETGSFAWAAASFVGMTAIAYAAALGVSCAARAAGL